MDDSMTLGPGEGKVLEARGSRMVFKAVAAVTDGTFSLMERDLPAVGGGHRRTRTRAHLKRSSCSRARSSLCSVRTRCGAGRGGLCWCPKGSPTRLRTVAPPRPGY